MGERRKPSRASVMKKRKRRLRIRRIRFCIALVILIAIITLVVSLIHKVIIWSTKKADPAYGITVNGIDLTGLERAEAEKALLDSYQWNLMITYNEQVYEVEDYLKEEAEIILDEVYMETDIDNKDKDLDKKSNYELEVQQPDTKADLIIEAIGDKWDDEAENSIITGYDAENGGFELSESKSGYVIDADSLKTELVNCFQEKNYETVIEAEKVKEEPAVTKDDYKVIATFTTTTTNNKDRNTNVSLACQAVNGTIIQAGEQFSYNVVVGQRTAEKGYKEAGAYANGEHVLEIGGGVCQLSSTMYDAAVTAGLLVDERTGHSYEPSYVIPGEDAAVSYENPDFKFTNNSKGSLGIVVSFVERTVTVKFYGVPILEEGVKQYMKSEKTEDTPIPDPTYELDPTLPMGTEVEKKAGKMGSVWVTNVVVEKDGEIISDTYLHTTKYKGTGAVIANNPINTEGMTPEQIAALQAQIAAQQALAAQQAAQQQATDTTGAPADATVTNPTPDTSTAN